jgi:hypothetical protein
VSASQPEPDAPRVDYVAPKDRPRCSGKERGRPRIQFDAQRTCVAAVGDIGERVGPDARASARAPGEKGLAAAAKLRHETA